MGASKKLASATALRAAEQAEHQSTIDGLRAIGVELANIFGEVIPSSEHHDTAECLMSLLNSIEANKPREEFRAVVIGALAGLGFEPVK
jgi:hypothetical protein